MEAFFPCRRAFFWRNKKKGISDRKSRKHFDGSRIYQGFARRIAPKVDLNIKAVLEHFTTYPWFYTIFEVEKIVGDGFLIAKIRDSHEMLFSKPAEAKAREGGGCMLGLLFSTAHVSRAGVKSYYSILFSKATSVFLPVPRHAGNMKKRE